MYAVPQSNPSQVSRRTKIWVGVTTGLSVILLAATLVGLGLWLNEVDRFFSTYPPEYVSGRIIREIIQVGLPAMLYAILLVLRARAVGQERRPHPSVSIFYWVLSIPIGLYGGEMLLLTYLYPYGIGL